MYLGRNLVFFCDLVFFIRCKCSFLWLVIYKLKLLVFKIVVYRKNLCLESFIAIFMFCGVVIVDTFFFVSRIYFIS